MIKASLPGSIAPSPICPTKPSIPPSATGVPERRPNSSATSLRSPPTAAPMSFTSCGYFSRKSSRPTAASRPTGKPPSFRSWWYFGAATLIDAVHSPVNRLMSQSTASQMCRASRQVAGSCSLSHRHLGSPHSAETEPKPLYFRAGSPVFAMRSAWSEARTSIHMMADRRWRSFASRARTVAAVVSTPMPAMASFATPLCSMRAVDGVHQARPPGVGVLLGPARTRVARLELDGMEHNRRPFDIKDADPHPAGAVVDAHQVGTLSHALLLHADVPLHALARQGARSVR